VAEQHPLRKATWAIIGGGNGGQALAGHLALMGHTVRLYDIIPETVAAIQRQGGIWVDGAVEGFGPLALATTHMDQALAGADMVMVVAPAVAHREIARACAPCLADGQVVLIHPGATGGALEFRKVLADEGCRAEVALSETNSLLYACRSRRPGQASIFGIKRELLVAALPASETDPVLKALRPVFPQMVAASNVLQTSLGNPNAMMHPAPTLLNTSLIESQREWLYYWDGITPTIGAFVEALDRERLAVAEAFGLHLEDIRTWYRRAYGAAGDTLSEAVRNNPAYAGVKGQKTLHTRYLLEDIPTGLIPMAALGRAAGVAVSRMELVIALGQYLTGKDLTSGGRTLANLGLEGMGLDAIQASIA
jgi:opine dehydrogenase